MTTTLLVLMPVALLVLISGFCFVGCTLDVHGLQAFMLYSDTDVIGNPSCVAYWPLNDAKFQTTALDVVGKKLNNAHHGTYRSVDIAADQGLFPCAGFNLAANVDTAEAPGTLILQAPGIVQGDTVEPHDPENPILTTAMRCNGAFVSVPVNSVVNQAGAFTIEAWALPAWADGDPGVFHSLIDSRDNNPAGIHGFAIWVNETGLWEAVLNCTNSTNVLLTAGKASLTKVSHVVVTLDDTNIASLFINGVLASVATPLPAGESFSPNTTKPFVIGVGAPWLPERQNKIGNMFFPIFPFNGTIQDVAIYNIALPASVIMTHFNNGSGIPGR